MSEAPYVLKEARDGVVALTLNRGERFNPLSSPMIAALQTHLDEVTEDPGSRVVVIKGAGRGFCAGHDLKEMRAHAGNDEAHQAWQRRLFDDCGRLMMGITQLPQPVIAQVHGIATAAGCQLVSMCDLAIAADDARFALPGGHIGVFCSTPAVGVARNIGRKRVMEMLLTGDPIDARTALEWGLVNRAVPAAELDAEVARWCDKLLSKSPVVTALGKQAFYRQVEQPLQGAYAGSGDAMACNLTLADAAEGMDAFLQKRSPKWQEPDRG